eukprot:snap_masked-scaffold_1-processed-gene-13.10-mRNA-1 protein AED:1.00 eAED:1.00 QI:0/-1/0/0/-1/1/1/0/238
MKRQRNIAVYNFSTAKQNFVSHIQPLKYISRPNCNQRNQFRPQQKRKRNIESNHRESTSNNKEKRSRINKNHNKKKDLFMLKKYMDIVASYGNTPEEIERWKKDRKKGFPTNEKVDRNCIDLEDTLDEVKETSQKKNKVEIPREKKKRICINFLNRTCKFGDKCKFPHDEERKAEIIEKRKQEIKRRCEEKFSGSKNKRIGFEDLLPALIQDEKDKELKAMKQIIHFICKNNFFLDAK